MGTDLSPVASLPGHPARSAMIDALMDGAALPADESEHLGRLVDAGLVTAADDALRFARTGYNHSAGRVALHDVFGLPPRALDR